MRESRSLFCLLLRVLIRLIPYISYTSCNHMSRHTALCRIASARSGT